MAAGDTDIAICSRALTLLGDSPISSFTEGTDASNTCSRIYPTLRGALLQAHPWRFATKKVALAQLVGTPVNEWTYKYQLPSDALGGPIAVFNSSSSGAPVLSGGWEIYEDTLLSNYSAIYVDYHFNPGESKFPHYFVLLLMYALASDIAASITELESKAEYWHVKAYGTPAENGRGGFFRQAANMDGQASSPEAITDFPLVQVRQ